MRGFRPLSQPIPPLALPRSLRRPRSTIPPITITSASLRGVMSSQREDSIPHELRTAAEPRQNRLYPVRLSHVELVNSSIRLLRFTIPTQENNVSSDLSFEESRVLNEPYSLDVSIAAAIYTTQPYLVKYYGQWLCWALPKIYIDKPCNTMRTILA